MTTQELWQSQAVEAPRINLDYLRARAGDTVRVARRRALLESLFALIALGVAVLIWSWYSDPWMRAGGVYLAIAGVVYSWLWRRLATPASLPADLGAVDTLRFHRRELERQHSMHLHLWRWLLPLFAPTFALLIYGQILLSPDSGTYLLTHKVPLVLAGFTVAICITRVRAAKFRREIELLDMMAR
jgi:hypothetical protein